ncbi:MAG: hypothetical protein E7233_03845 [Lachnospiraceae bacterium]|nr:hypothetical protein [Lachnospiraceae bacterium]
MNEHLIEIIAVVFGSQGLWTLINNVYQERKKKKKKTPFELMVLALVREKLLYLSKQYIKMGGIPEDEVSAFKELYKSYIEAGGNTNVKELGDRASTLPIIFEEN